MTTYCIYFFNMFVNFFVNFFHFYVYLSLEVFRSTSSRSVLLNIYFFFFIFIGFHSKNDDAATTCLLAQFNIIPWHSCIESVSELLHPVTDVLALTVHVVLPSTKLVWKLAWQVLGYFLPFSRGMTSSCNVMADASCCKRFSISIIWCEQCMLLLKIHGCVDFVPDCPHAIFVILRSYIFCLSLDHLF